MNERMNNYNEKARAAWALEKQGLKYRQIGPRIGIKIGPRGGGTYRVMLLCGRGRRIEEGIGLPPQHSYRPQTLSTFNLLLAKNRAAIGHDWKES